MKMLPAKQRWAADPISAGIIRHLFAAGYSVKLHAIHVSLYVCFPAIVDDQIARNDCQNEADLVAQSDQLKLRSLNRSTQLWRS